MGVFEANDMTVALKLTLKQMYYISAGGGMK